jgi:hypothetical protein
MDLHEEDAKEKLSDADVERLAEELLSKEMLWLGEHKLHGKIHMQHLVDVSCEVHWDEINWVSMHDTQKFAKWEFKFVCTCGEKFILVDENTPEELKAL